ncbi:hypothetical protein ACFL6Y_00915 [Elusimicrobiota bacterium]
MITEEYIKKATAQGEIAFERVGVIRADSVSLGSFKPYLNNNIIAAKAYNTTEKTNNTGFFLIEGRITELFKF